MSTSSITQQALKWNPQAKSKRGRPKHSMRRDLITDIEEVRYSWREIERWPRIGDVGGGSGVQLERDREMAQDRRRWRTVVGGLCPGRV